METKTVEARPKAELPDADRRSLDLNIARARVALSLIAILSLWIDPNTAGGFLNLTCTVATTLLAHLAYSTALMLLLGGQVALAQVASWSIVLDLVFATAISFITGGHSGPSNVFFVFAIIAAANRPDFRPTLAVISAIVLYSLVNALAARNQFASMMRPVYLGILGYLIAFVGQQRVTFEGRLHELEKRTERVMIARSLHDGYVQALAGVNLRLETSRALLAGGRVEETINELRELQTGVTREYDHVRAYIRSLAGLDDDAPQSFAYGPDPRVRLRAEFAGTGLTGEHLMLIMLEALRNARRHSTAHQVEINLTGIGSGTLLTIEDDGIGFTNTMDKPWAIASRVAELGGNLSIAGGQGATRLTIELPQE